MRTASSCAGRADVGRQEQLPGGAQDLDGDRAAGQRQRRASDGPQSLRSATLDGHALVDDPLSPPTWASPIRSRYQATVATIPSLNETSGLVAERLARQGDVGLRMQDVARAGRPERRRDVRAGGVADRPVELQQAVAVAAGDVAGDARRASRLARASRLPWTTLST